MDERAAFEHAIDQNPVEASTHYAYSDWLRENGEHDEADFRKEMGDYMKEWGHRHVYGNDGPPAWPYRPMENALREAWMRSRTQQNQQRLQRKARAAKYRRVARS